MSLPTNQDLLKLFSAFLFEAGLSSVSVKNYLSDIRHFLAFSSHVDSVDADQPVRDIFQNLSKYVNLYTDDQKSNYVPTNTINRRLASIRRFSTFLKSTFDISESGLAHNVSSKSSSNVSGQSTSSFRFSDHSDDDPFKKILNQFKSYLDKEKKTHATVKNYLSDINHFISWSANQTPFTSQDLKNIVSKNQLNAYTTYEKLSHTSTSVINRRYSSIKKFAQFAFENNYLPDNPFERKTNSVRLAPLSWLDRLSKTNPNRVDQKQNHSRIQNLYQKYNQLPFTPYLHLAILVLATSAMAIFAYNQIITAAFPSQAAGLPTVPNRQLSFQGRLTDSSSNPITTNVNVTFRLYDALTSGTNLYNSGACSITPDQNGIFSTLIGNGTCGAAIPATVFSNNRDVFIEIQVASETLTPRQQIATVGFALNAETLQGYPASTSATINTVPVMDNNGNIVLAQLNPSIVATGSSGLFTIRGDSVAIQTTAGSGGNIVIQPDTTGTGNVQILPSGATGNQLRISDANLTTGTLISGYSGNNNDAPGLLVLSSGSSETERFAVRADGQTRITSKNTLTDAALMVNQAGSGDIFTASQSGANKFVIKNDGKVGISITNPSFGLEVNDTARINGNFTMGDASGDTVTSNAGTWSFVNPTTVALNNAVNSLNFDSNTLVIDALNNRVGIGVTNPGYSLDVQGGQVNASGGLCMNGDCRTSWGSITGINFWDWTTGVLSPHSISDAINLGNAATASATVHLAGVANDNSFINNGGNFGIGLANPSFKLDVAGNTNIAGNLGVTGYATVAASIAVGYTNAPAGTGSAIFSGNVGIGSTNPPVKLEAVGGVSGSETDILQVRSNFTATGTGSNIRFMNSTSNAATNGAGEISVVRTGTNTSNMYFRTANSSATLTTALTLDSAGNAGIGTTTPTAKLDVAGDASTSGSLVFRGTNPSTIDILNGNRLDFQTSVGGDTGSAPKMTLTNAGQLGVGLTNPAYTIDAVGSINASISLCIAGDCRTNWSTVTGTNFWSYNTGVLTPVEPTNAINLGNTATASATVHLAGKTGDNSFVNTGNFGIGTTTPTAKLDVAGDASTSGSLVFRGTNPSSIDILNGNRLDFQTSVGGDTGLTPMVSLTNNGNIGIGITNPSYSLQINRTGAMTTGIGISDRGYFYQDGSNFVHLGNSVGGAEVQFSTYAQFNTSVLGTNFDSFGALGLGNNNATTINIGHSGIVTNVNSDLNVTGYATVSGSVAIGFTNVVAGPGNLAVKGNVGIGITNPSAYLNIKAGTATAGTAPLKFTAGTNLTAPEAGAMEWDGTHLFITQTTGPTRQQLAYFSDITATNFWQRNAGVLSPINITDDLAIGGTATASGAPNDAKFQVFANTGNATTSGDITVGYNQDIKSAYGPLNLSYKSGAGTWGTALTVQDTTGNIGIGTANPLALLHVSKSTAGIQEMLRLDNPSNIATATSDLNFRVGSTDTTKAFLSNGFDGSNFYLSMGAGNAATEIMRLTNGKVGIGITNPSSPLSVVGVADIGTLTGTYIRINSSPSAASDGRISVGSNLANANLTLNAKGTGSINLNYDDGTGGIGFYGGTSTRQAFINSSGQAYLGGSATPANTLDVNGSAAIGYAGTVAPTSGLIVSGLTGMGITNPTGSKLTVADAGSTTSSYTIAHFYSGNAPTAGNLYGIGIDKSGTDVLMLGVNKNTVTGSIPANSSFISTYAATNTLAFGRGNNAGLPNTADMFISATGGVGINTTTIPTGIEFMVSGDASVSSSLTMGANAQIISAAGPLKFATPGSTSDGMTLNLLSGAYSNLIVNGQVLPQEDATTNMNLGSAANTWGKLYLKSGIYDDLGTSTISFGNPNLLANGNWEVSAGTLAVGVPGAGQIVLDSSTGGGNNGTITVGSAGDGKVNVGTVDPPYTINGQKYSTYLPGMIGIKEEVTGKLATSEYVDGVGYRTVLDLTHQPEGSDLWIFSKTTNLASNIGKLSILLTAQSQARTWYEIDETHQILAVYSSSPTTISFRMTAPRFDDAKWATYTPDRKVAGLIVNNPDTPVDPNGVILPNYLAQITQNADGTFVISTNGKENKEQGSFFQLLAANFKAGIATITQIVADNIVVKEKLVSPVADIETLNTSNLTAKQATVSGTLYADNIQSTTVDSLSNKLSVLGDQYSTASAILADLQAKYNSYDSLLNPTASSSSNLLAYDPLLTPTASVPADLVLNSLQVATLNSKDILVGGTLLANSLNSNNSDLYIQPDMSKPVHILGDLMALLPSGKVVINGDLLLKGTLYADAVDTKTATISGQLAIGNTDTASVSANKLIALYGNSGDLVSSVDASGSANFQQVATNELVIAASSDQTDASASASTNSNASIGSAIMPANQSELFIPNNRIDGYTLVYLTPVSDTQNQVLYVKSKEDGKGFTVSVNTPVPQDIRFNYWLVKTK